MKYLIVGLGNIGEEYVNTRHNIGFVVLDAFALDRKVRFESVRYADVAKAKFKGKQIVLAKPSTYMNNSGKAVRYWINKENVPIENTLIILDDIALPLGVLRVRKKGGDGGHNGLISTIEKLGTSEFTRLRIGIGDEFARGYQVDYVLGKWTKKEEEIMIPRVKASVDIIKSFISVGVDRTMNIYNTKGS